MSFQILTEHTGTLYLPFWWTVKQYINYFDSFIFAFILRKAQKAENHIDRFFFSSFFGLTEVDQKMQPRLK